MKILNWVQGKLDNSIKMVSHKRGISVTNEMVDTRVLLDSVNLEGLDDILAIGTFGFDLSNSKAEEEIADSESLVVQCQETEAGPETNMGISKPTIDTCTSIATVNEVCLCDNEVLSNQLNSDDNNAKKTKKMTLADLFSADDCFFRNPDNGSNITDVKKSSDCHDNCEERVETVPTTTTPAASAALIQTKDGPSYSFIKKLPIPCITAGKDSSCLLYSHIPVRKLHRMMAKMLKKKKKIHPAAVQYNGEIADIETDIMGVQRLTYG